MGNGKTSNTTSVRWQFFLNFTLVIKINILSLFPTGDIYDCIITND